MKLFKTESKTIDCKVDCQWYAIVAVSLLLIPFPWVLAWLFASFAHEFCHILALRAFRVRIYSLRLSLRGICLVTEDMSHIAQIFCALAGPFGGILLCFTSRVWPQLAICAFVQSVYNLIPVYPQDGGRALRFVLDCFLSRNKARLVENAIRLTVIICLGAVLLYFVITGPITF